MPSTPSGGTPPEVPEQFQDAYRRAYERALEQPETSVETAPTAHVSSTEYRTGRPAWFFPVAVVAGALVLIACAYVLGRMVSGGEEAGAPAEEPTEVAESTAPESPAPSRTAPPPPAEPYEGAVAPVRPAGAEAACTAKPGVDAAGRPVRYDASNMVDGEPATAWRCEGRAIGQELVFTLPEGTELAEVGLVPGYAKTDAKSRVDRYAENNRITRVTWILADGTEVEQRMSADPKDRSMRIIRVPATAGDRVTLRIEDVQKGKRNTTLVSEVRLAAVG